MAETTFYAASQKTGPKVTYREASMGDFPSLGKCSARSGKVQRMDQCTFCPIAAGEIDGDLVALRTTQVFVLPALRQHPTNHGHALVLPVTHTRNLTDASPSVRDEIFAVAAQLTSVMPSLYGAEGSIVFQNNTAPDDPLFHLHVHIVPRFPDDEFVMTRAAVAGVPRSERLQQAALIRRALNGPCH